MLPMMYPTKMTAVPTAFLVDSVVFPLKNPAECRIDSTADQITVLEHALDPVIPDQSSDTLMQLDEDSVACNLSLPGVDLIRLQRFDRQQRDDHRSPPPDPISVKMHSFHCK